MAQLDAAASATRPVKPLGARKLRAEADKQALELLTDEQGKAFEKMKGKKFELETRTSEPKKPEKKPATT